METAGRHQCSDDDLAETLGQLHALEMAVRSTLLSVAVDAPALSAAHLALLARRRRPVTPEGADRCLRIRPDHQSGWMRLWGRLPGSDGAVVARAVERLAEAASPDPDSGLAQPFEARCADALTELASRHLATEADADRACVVVHVDAQTLAGRSDEGAEVVDAPAIAAEAARRLACDARVEFFAERDGQVLGVGRTRRTVPAWLGRHLRRRDGGCRFPGCERTRWTQAHHIVHWANGGSTDSSNLITLCHFHHVLLHEGGWRLSGDPDHEVCFLHPDGRPLATGPPRLRADVAKRLGRLRS